MEHSHNVRLWDAKAFRRVLVGLDPGEDAGMHGADTENLKPTDLLSVAAELKTTSRDLFTGVR
jgi:hypothetical protein